MGLRVSAAAATIAPDGQPRRSEGPRTTLPVVLGAAGCAAQRERRPGARLLCCPARPRALRHRCGGAGQCHLTARLAKVRANGWAKPNEKSGTRWHVYCILCITYWHVWMYMWCSSDVKTALTLSASYFTGK